MLVFRRELSHISGFLRSSFRYSTATSDAQKTRPHFLEDYLVDSLGFSKDSAISACAKYKVKATHLQNPNNPDLVVNLFKDYGLGETQIKDIVSSFPQILSCKANKTLEPKLRVLRDLGLSGSDLAKFIKRRRTFFYSGLNTMIFPTVDYLKQLLNSDEKVLEFFRSSSSKFYTLAALKRMQANVLLLQNHGISIDRIREAIVKYPRCVQSRHEDVEKNLSWCQDQLGISSDSPFLWHALRVRFSCSEPVLEEKMQVFRSFGWSNSELSSLLSSQPLCLTYSATCIREKLKFFMSELQYKPLSLIKNHSLLTYALEKRVKPRYKILNILKEKKLIRENLSLQSVATYSELKFLAFIRCFESEVPGLSETYTNSVKKASKIT